jgi:hypothetical protein
MLCDYFVVFVEKKQKIMFRILLTFIYLLFLFLHRYWNHIVAALLDLCLQVATFKKPNGLIYYPLEIFFFFFFFFFLFVG